MAEFRRALVILNPVSGRHDADESEATIRDALETRGIEVVVRRTTGEDDAERWAAAAHDEAFDLVLAAGGDGTVAGALAGLLVEDDPLVLGIVPLGTGNGLARALHIPLRQDAALDAVLDGRVVELDVGRIEPHGRTFILFAGAGYDADVNQDADRGEKDRLGFLAYVVAVIRHLGDRHNHRVTLTLDGRRRRMRAHTVSVFNAGEFTFAGVPIGPHVRPDDGLLDIAVLRAPSLWGTFSDLWRLLSGRPKKGEMTQARRVRLEARPPLRVHADGEVLGETPFEIGVVPGKARLLAPAEFEL